jgi:hypothetical protein
MSEVDEMASGWEASEVLFDDFVSAQALYYHKVVLTSVSLHERVCIYKMCFC